MWWADDQWYCPKCGDEWPDEQARTECRVFVVPPPTVREACGHPGCADSDGHIDVCRYDLLDQQED